MCVDCHAAKGVTTHSEAARRRPRPARRALRACWPRPGRPRPSPSPSRPARPTAASRVTASPASAPIDVNGVEKSLTIDVDTWHSSMHSRLDCTACHAGFEARKHTAAETQGWYTAGQAHRVQRLPRRRVQDVRPVLPREPRDERGLHEGAGLRRLPRLARHHRPDARPRSGRPIPQVCGRCHGEKSATYLDTYHGKSVDAGRPLPGGLHRLPRLPQDPAEVGPAQHRLVAEHREDLRQVPRRTPTPTSPASSSTSTAARPTRRCGCG